MYNAVAMNDVSDGTTPPDDFAPDIQQALGRVRSALIHVFHSVGADPAKPQTVSRLLRLDKSLAWKVCKIVTDTDPLATIDRLPGKSGMKIVFDRLDSAHAPIATVKELRAAVDAFDSAVAAHAGTRPTLAVMLGHAQGDTERDEAFRKMSFQGNSATFGVRAKAQFALHFICPSQAAPNTADAAIICGMIGFHRLRHDAHWAIAQTRLVDDQWRSILPGKQPEATHISVAFEPMDPTRSPGDLPLMPDFCSRPLAAMRARSGANGITRLEVDDGPVGVTGAATIVMGWLTRGKLNLISGPDNQMGEHGAQLGTPAEAFYQDIFVHSSLSFAHQPTAHVYSMLPGGPNYPHDGNDAGLLPIKAQPFTIDASDPHLSLPELPDYRQIIDLAFSRLGVRASDMIGLRRVVPFPPMPALALLRHPLMPPGPNPSHVY